MPESAARRELVQRMRGAAERDERIAGMLDYGSSSEGRVDEWSDIDVAIFLRDADFDAFTRDWKEWAAQFGELLLAYVRYVGHPWTIYAAEPVPLRVDFDLHRESTIEEVVSWPNSPLSVASMVWCDKTGGRLSAYVRQLIGQPLRPADVGATFEQVCGDFWYFLLMAFCKLQRGQQWFARELFHQVVLDNLFRLLRLEANVLDRWPVASTAWNIERLIAPGRLAQLDACIPAAGTRGLRQALFRTAQLGREVCEAIAAHRGWVWPDALGERVVRIMEPSASEE
jgi:lincosamide nucleotidyltransferase